MLYNYSNNLIETLSNNPHSRPLTGCCRISTFISIFKDSINIGQRGKFSGAISKF